MAEQRRTGRAQIDILLNKYVGGVPYTARARDISPGGVRLSRLLEPEHAGRRVGLQFQLPGSDEVIYAEGEVVREWIEAENAQADGVRFTLLTERHRQADPPLRRDRRLGRRGVGPTSSRGVPGRAQRRGAFAPGARAPPVAVLDTLRRRHV